MKKKPRKNNKPEVGELGQDLLTESESYNKSRCGPLKLPPGSLRRGSARGRVLEREEEHVLGTKIKVMMKIVMAAIERLDTFEQPPYMPVVTRALIEQITPFLNTEDIKLVKIGIKARKVLVEANVGHAYKIAKQYRDPFFSAFQSKTEHDTTSDYFQDAIFGLLLAAEKFDPTRGYKFSTYSRLWMQQSIQRANQARGGLIKVGLTVFREQKEINDFIVLFVQKNHRKPSLKEISEGTKKTEKRINEIHRCIILFSMVSTDSQLLLRGELQCIENLFTVDRMYDEAHASNLFDGLSEKEQFLVSEIMDLVARLPEKEKVALEGHYGTGASGKMTKEQIAETIKIDVGDVAQLVKNVEAKLRYVLEVLSSNRDKQLKE